MNYCENYIDCRRTQQLEYFGEHFCSEQCLKNRAAACDNCLRTVQYKETDVTEQSMIIMRGVRDLCSGTNQFTILHMSDVLKGASNKNVLKNNHNLNDCYGKLKNWDKMDIQRLMHKMVIEQYLMENLKFAFDSIQPYIYLGPRAKNLMNSRSKLMFSLTDKKSKNAKQVEVSSSNDLFGKCYDELVNEVCIIAYKNNIKLDMIFDIHSLKVS